MNESGKKKSDGLFIVGGIALIAVLVIAIKLPVLRRNAPRQLPLGAVLSLVRGEDRAVI